MDRSWMYGKRTTLEYLTGVEEFSRVAVEHQSSTGNDYILCPCIDCDCLGRFRNIEQIKAHLIRRGFRDGYTRWIWHGEDITPTSTEGEDLYDGSNSKREIGENDDDDDGDENVVENDRIDEMMQDVEDHINGRPGIHEHLTSAAEKPLYPGCTKDTVLSAVLKLYNLKAEHGVSDTYFSKLLETLHDMFPEGNELPSSSYCAMKLISPLGMPYEKIHACPNDCVLYRNEYKDMKKCPKCGEERYKHAYANSGWKDKKGPPAKAMWYLPIKPRFERLFASVNDAENLRWHANRKKDKMIRHPADASQWQAINEKFVEFGDDPRNLRLGLSTDGISPFGMRSSKHSTWPVFLCIYNLPPWLCLKRRYIMMPILISGPKQPGNDIDVYLAPLVEELIQLWNEGFIVYDAYTKTHFNLRAMVFCTINDFPAHGNLSGYTNKGKKACPICEDDMVVQRLKHCMKHVYMHHRRFLPIDHVYRKMRKPFINNATETRVARQPLTGVEVYEQVKDIETIYGKPNKPSKGSLYKKRSILWDLPYWKDLEVRHCLDVMHIEKNVCDAIVGTLLNIPKKSKDGLNVRRDYVEMKTRKELQPTKEKIIPKGRGNYSKRMVKAKEKDDVHVEVKKNGIYLPPACYTLSEEEKKSFYDFLRGVKVPAGYSSNIRKFVGKSDFDLAGMKSHDCHVMMQEFLPLAIRGILPKNVANAITRFCFFFKAICSKEIDSELLDTMQDDLIETLCQFEMYFPPSFFDIMPHLTAHLIWEIKICGPVFLRWNYPFERQCGTLKDKVRNRARPEASIVKGVVAEEVMAFCSQYLQGVDCIGLPKSRHEGRLEGLGTIGSKTITISQELKDKAHLYVLYHLSAVHSYLQEYMDLLKRRFPSKNEMWLLDRHKHTFISWFKERVMCQLRDKPSDVQDLIRWLAYGPSYEVISYEGYDINGYSFYTERQDNKSTMQNSGVTLVASSTVSQEMSYYGVIEDIWELDYGAFNIPVFRCKWVDNHRGLKRDELGYTLLDFSKLGYVEESFILASQAKQVFYCTDPIDKSRSIVVESKRRILGICDVVDEEEYDKLDDNPPLYTQVPLPSQDDDMDTNYVRLDHNEGEWVDSHEVTDMHT